jgi:hypothetical protein
MNIVTILIGVLIAAFGIFLALNAFYLHKVPSKMDIMEQKFGMVGKILYIVCYVLFPILFGGFIAWAGTLGVSLKDVLFS